MLASLVFLSDNMEIEKSMVYNMAQSDFRNGVEYIVLYIFPPIDPL